MIEPRKALLSLQDRLHHRVNSPSLHNLKAFHDDQEKHASAKTLDQLEPVRMCFVLADRRGRRTQVELLVTGLEDFDPERGKVRVIGLRELTFVAIDYDIKKRLGSFSNLKRHPRR